MPWYRSYRGISPARMASAACGGGLLHHHPAEPAVQRRILADGLAVLLRRGGADQLDLPPGQHGFEDAGRIDGALGGTGSRNDVNLIDEQDGGPVPVELLQQVFEPLLKIAPVFGARHHGCHVQRQHPLAL